MSEHERDGVSNPSVEDLNAVILEMWGNREAIEAAYMARVMASGQLQTEAGTEALVNNQMIGGIEEDFVDEGQRLISLGGDRFQVVTDSAYLETLERAVLVSYVNDGVCQVCRTILSHDHEADAACDYMFANYKDHAAGCIVLALLEKYP